VENRTIGAAWDPGDGADNVVDAHAGNR
jgi:hypothetical protein